MARYKIVTHAPLDVVDLVRGAAGAAGAGIQGNYSHCSFSIRGIGRFKPEVGASPAIGQVGELETVEEELIEFICDEVVVSKTIEAIKIAHPYEEVPIEVYKLEDY